MAKRENDQTQGMAAPAVIIAAIRSGGTFLAHCLSNHPQIFCARGEPLHHLSEWVRALRPDRRKLLAALLNQTGYHVSMVKLTYPQAFHPDIWPWLEKRRPLVIWLRRENYIRQAVSVLVNRSARAGAINRAQHTFVQARPLRLELEPERILAKARELRVLDSQARGRLSGIRHMLPVTYADVIGGECAVEAEFLPMGTTVQICAFLDVRIEPLRCDLKKVNPYPLRELLSNWPIARSAIGRSEFGHCLDDEES